MDTLARTFERDMTERAQPLREDSEERQINWRNTMAVAAVSALGGVIVAGTLAFGSKVMTTGETTTVLSVKIDQIFDQNRSQDSLLRSLADKQYTRDEAMRDRERLEAFSRVLDGRISELVQRTNTLEQEQRRLSTEQRMLQQFLYERGPAPTSSNGRKTPQ